MTPPSGNTSFSKWVKQYEASLDDEGRAELDDGEGRDMPTTGGCVEAKYKVGYGLHRYYFEAWLEIDGRRRNYYDFSVTSTATLRPGSQAVHVRMAKRECKRLLRDYQRQQAAREVRGTVTPGGRPSYDSLRARILELEAELEIA